MIFDLIHQKLLAIDNSIRYRVGWDNPNEKNFNFCWQLPWQLPVPKDDTTLIKFRQWCCKTPVQILYYFIGVHAQLISSSCVIKNFFIDKYVLHFIIRCKFMVHRGVCLQMLRCLYPSHMRLRDGVCLQMLELRGLFIYGWEFKLSVGCKPFLQNLFLLLFFHHYNNILRNSQIRIYFLIQQLWK